MQDGSINFASDNVRGCAPAILQAVVAGLDGAAPAYGEDDASRRLEARFAELFETDVAVAPVLTGTAANALGLSMLVPPHGAILCHADAHIARAEGTGPELFTGGARPIGVPGDRNKLSIDALAAALAGQRAARYHGPLVTAVSLTQQSELGTHYRVDEVAALADWAHGEQLAVHMDGARFANAVAGLGVTPADITWRAGVDALSFGGSKNGCIAGEAVVLFNPSAAQRRDLLHKRQRAGQVLSKHRFLALQFEAYLKDGLWLDLARHANGQAARLAEGLAAVSGVDFLAPVQGNQLFFSAPTAVEQAWRAAGVGFADWGGGVRRMVTAFDTDPNDVDTVIALAREAREGAAPGAARTA